MYADDTIAAIATPLGSGGLGVIRISGPLCTDIARALFAGRRPVDRWQTQRLYHGRLHDETGATLDDGLATVMRAPHSYTGEDVLELHCHGSPIVLRRLLAAALRCGARLAEPGEFTKRAFLNGRLDLAQAEAVVDLVRARSSGAADLAVQQLAGQLSGQLAELREHLIRLKALLEAQIDFSEEDFAVAPSELLIVLDSCIVTIQQLVNTYRHGALLRDGARVVIIGKPNVGKSSLLNALLGEDRAIVTPVAGTTRDSIDETSDFAGIPVVLSDTAGLREAARADAVERLGMQRTTEKMATAELLLCVLDSATPLDAEDRAVLHTSAARPSVIVLNKIDLGDGLPRESVRPLAGGAPIVSVSAKERVGLQELRTAVATALSNGVRRDDGGPVLTNLRHHVALTKAFDSLRLARQSICDQQPPDVVAVDVQDALDHVGAVTGVVTTEDVLDRVFGQFCIGK